MDLAPVFSLILATCGRVEEVKRFVASLDAQRRVDVELIVVDQNDDDRLLGIVSGKREYNVQHVRASQRGLSKARNLGLHYVRGSIVGFPDDDCWYPHGLLDGVEEWFEQHADWDGLTGRSIDACGNPSNGKFSLKGGPITFLGVWSRAISYTVFLRVGLVKTVGGFDEVLGAGAGSKYGSAEETDYLLRSIVLRKKIYYEPSVTVFHPQAPVGAGDRTAARRARLYGAGMGYVVQKHRHPLWFVAYVLAKPLLGAAASIAALRLNTAKYRWHTFVGRMEGAAGGGLRRRKS